MAEIMIHMTHYNGVNALLYAPLMNALILQWGVNLSLRCIRAIYLCVLPFEGIRDETQKMAACPLKCSVHCTYTAAFLSLRLI